MNPRICHIGQVNSDVVPEALLDDAAGLGFDVVMAGADGDAHGANASRWLSLDPHNAQEADFEIPLWERSLPDHCSLEVEELLHGHYFSWRGKIQHLRLTPEQPYAIWRVAPAREG
jgi:hypothetical protein